MAETLHVNVPTPIMRGSANENAASVNQLLFGEKVEVLETAGKWQRIKSLHDGYEGFVPEGILGQHGPKTHRVDIPLSHAYSVPDFKAPSPMPLYFLSQVGVTGEKSEGFVRLDNGRWVFEEHLRPLNKHREDFVETALMFLGVPYLWGGRSVSGLDCSGLVQIGLMASGIPCPRDSHEQITIGKKTSPDDLQRGDLVFFKSHVGIMLDDQHILNATSRSMDTRIEIVDNLAGIYNGILGIRRI